MLSDAELLQRYEDQRDENAFRVLVQRHLGLVYAAALRRTGGRAHLAEEICQKVFTDLARKAASLHHHPALTAWLHRSTRYAAVDAIRAEVRRQKLQETLATMPETQSAENTAVAWGKLRPVLDEAMDQLKESDRSAMVLRYFEGLSFADIGARLGLSENAARMRAERALGRLRFQLGRRGVTSTAGALGLLLANRAVAVAPEGLADSVAGTALTQASQAAGAGSFSALVAGRLVTGSVAAVVLAGVGFAGWRWAGPGRHRGENPQMAIAADGFAANAMEVYRILALVHPIGSDHAAGGTSGAKSVASGEVLAAAREVMLNFAKASRARDVPRLAQLLTFDTEGTAVAQSIQAKIPPALREQLRTPEELFAFFYATDTLLSPVPPAKFLETFIATEIKPGRAAVHRPGTPPRGLEFVLTADGWKYEIPTPYLAILADRILSNEILARLNALPEVRAHSVQAAPIAEGTARASLLVFAQASNRGDVPTVARMLHFDPAARMKALAFMDTLEPALKGKWNAPEELAAELFVNGAIHNPFPAESALAAATEARLGDARVALLLSGATRDRFEFQHTASGWKYVVTETMANSYLQRLATERAARP